MTQLLNTDFNRNPVPETIAAKARGIITDLSVAEKVYMMSGHGFFEKFLGEDNRTFGMRAYQAGGGNERLDIAPLLFTDGPKGVRIGQPTTCFPVVMARGASWDVDLEQRIGDVIGIESRALGVTLNGSVCINLLRHPAWGRAQETYGEDPHLLGEMGAALCQGIQAHNVITSVKHFAVNSLENTRFEVNVTASERTLREVYLPHFKRVIDAGCASVMSAYNKLNGHYCAHNHWLLRDVLKGEWKFAGFVHSDWIKGCYGPDAADAGLDIENPEAIFFGKRLVNAVENGEIAEDVLDEAVFRILTTQMRFADQPDPRSYSVTDVCAISHKDLAREAAEKSMVLLKNDDLLPLDPAKGNKIALIGDLAAMENLGDKGSSKVVPPYVVTLLDGLRARTEIELLHCDGKNHDEAAALAREADVTIVVAGYTHVDEGEFIPGNEAMGTDEGVDNTIHIGGDRASLKLRAEHEALISAVVSETDQLCVAVMGGSAITMEAWQEKAAAILLTWYPGMEGGHAFARLLLGEVAPEGRLPFTIPRSESDLPFFDRTATEIEYGLYHGYTLLDHVGKTAAYPFGFGLGYTSFAYRDLRVDLKDDRIEIAVTVENTGSRAGRETVQLYAGPDGSKIDRPRKLLKGFAKCALEPGEAQTCRFTLCRSDVMWFDEAAGEWAFEDLPYRIFVGPNVEAAEALSVVTRLP